MEVQPLLGENPESYMDSSSLTHSGAIRTNDKFSNKRNLFEQCRVILSKSYESRIPAENNTLLRLLDKSQFLKELSENISLDFIKGIFRYAKIETIEERQVIAEEDQQLNYMVIVLEGKLGVEKSNFSLPNPGKDKGRGKDTIQTEEMKSNQMFEKLTMLAKKERDLQKTKSKLQRKSSIPVSSYDLSLPVLSENDYQQFGQKLSREIFANQEYGARERLMTKTYRNRVASLEKTTLLVIQISFLFYWLEAAFKVKLARNIELMKTIPCFTTIEEEKLAEIILSMKHCTRSKGDMIYHQGETSEMLYILIKGQVKLNKKSFLFKENPNDLYIDRRKLFEQLHKDDKKYRSKSSRKSNEDVLPFANFTTLYNYRPTKKVIQIGVISSFGLFGQEEIVYKKRRQISTIVDSLEAVYYEVEFKKILDIVGPKIVEKFKEDLETSVSKKILYRQSEFAGHIGLQNKKNLDYFYLEDGKQKESPRNFKLEKLNDRMSPRKPKDDNTHAPAYYTSFNFNKMPSKQRYSDLGTKHEVRREAKKSVNQQSSESLKSVVLNNAEQRMVGISHSWCPIEKKVKQQKMMSRKISPFKHEINIQAPLIDQQYFRHVAKEKQRISKEYRTFKLSLGKKLK